MDFLGSLGTGLDVVLLIIPVVVAIYLIMKFVYPKRPALAIGLAAGAGVLGALLVRRRLKRSDSVEGRIAEHNAEMADFREKQKTRHDAVLANNERIRVLESQRKRLEKHGDRYQEELDLIDAELADRRARSAELLKGSGPFFDAMRTRTEARRTRSAARTALLSRFGEHFGIVGADTEAAAAAAGAPVSIEIDGHRLLEG